MTDRRYHVELKDDYSGESLGLILTEKPQLGLDKRLINPYAAKTGQGDTQYSDLTEWTVVAQDDWRGGRGQDKYEDKGSYFDAGGVETRIEGQITLGPKPTSPASDNPVNESASEGRWLLGDPYTEQCTRGSGESGAIPHGNTTKLAQRVSAPYHSTAATRGAMSLVSVQLSLSKESGFADGDSITCSVYSDSDGEPDSSLGSASLSGSDLTTSFAWETFTFTSPIDLSSHSDWWIVLSTASSDKAVQWQSAYDDDSYSRGYAAQYISGSWYTLEAVELDWLFKADWAEVKLAQSFTTVGSFDLDDIWLHGDLGKQQLTIGLYSDSGDAPDTKVDECVVGHFNNIYVLSPNTTTELTVSWTAGALLADMWVLVNDEIRQIDSVGAYTITLSSALTSAPESGDVVEQAYPAGPGWIRARLSTGPTLSAATKYWIVVEVADHDDWLSSAHPNNWNSLNYGGTYANGTCKQQIASESWTDLETDLLFRLNDFALDGDVTGFARFGGEWYCATGPSVFKYDDDNTSWSEADGDDEAGIDSTDTVTGLAVWGGYIWAARGSDHVIRKSSDGSSWSDVTGENGNLLKAAGGYLHYSGTGSDDHKVYYTADGSTFSELGECGAGEHAVTAMAYYRDTLFASTAIELWSLAIEGNAYPVLDWSSQEDDDNGKGMAQWNKTNCLYIPLRYGLYRWNGDSMVAVGPERGTGLPEGRSGAIVDLCPTNNWLYAAIDAGANKTSSVLCYNGMGGWHEMARADEGQRVKALGFSTINTPSRLWYGVSDETRYLELPDRSDNPWQWRDRLAFKRSGYLTTSWFGTDLLEVWKNIHEIVLRGEDMDDDLTVDVRLEVDRNDTDISWGVFDASPRKSITWGSEDWHAPSWEQKAITSGSSSTEIYLDSDAGGMRPGEFVRINAEVSQIERIGESGGTDILYLGSALSEAPEDGDIAYAASPAGREFRLKLLFNSNSGVETTPKVDALLVRYQNHVLDRYLWTLHVNVEDMLKDLGGADYGLSAADLRAELDSWATRIAPFTLVDVDGREHRVKITSAGEGGFSREKKAGGNNYYGSTYSMNLVEVE